MYAKTAALMATVFAVFMLGNLAASCFAADEAGDLKLSKALAQAKLFAEFTDDERDLLKPAAALRHGKAGERIIVQGETLDRMFIVIEGQTEIWIKGKRIAAYSGQALVGEFEFLGMGSATADVILAKEADLIELNFAKLNDLVEKQPRLGCKLMRGIAKIEIQRIIENDKK